MSDNQNLHEEINNFETSLGKVLQENENKSELADKNILQGETFTLDCHINNRGEINTKKPFLVV